MKKQYILSLALVLLIMLGGCKKETRIRHELSGTWEIEKAEISTYVNGEIDSTSVLENLGTLEFADDRGTAPEFNICYFSLAQNYWPLGFNELNNTQARQNGYCHWYGDLRARDRVTFWSSGGFALADRIFVIYTRIKTGKKEQWMYIDLNASGEIIQKEILYVKLVDGSGKIQ